MCIKRNRPASALGQTNTCVPNKSPLALKMCLSNNASSKKQFIWAKRRNDDAVVWLAPRSSSSCITERIECQYWTFQRAPSACAHIVHIRRPSRERKGLCDSNLSRYHQHWAWYERESGADGRMRCHSIFSIHHPAVDVKKIDINCYDSNIDDVRAPRHNMTE